MGRGPPKGFFICIKDIHYTPYVLKKTKSFSVHKSLWKALLYLEEIQKPFQNLFFVPKKISMSFSMYGKSSEAIFRRSIWRSTWKIFGYIFVEKLWRIFLPRRPLVFSLSFRGFLCTVGRLENFCTNNSFQKDIIGHWTSFLLIFPQTQISWV